jgi:hypothetical protein
MNWPAIAAIWLMPSAKPRWRAGKASVRIAAERDHQHSADMNTAIVVFDRATHL